MRLREVILKEAWSRYLLSFQKAKTFFCINNGPALFFKIKPPENHYG